MTTPVQSPEGSRVAPPVSHPPLQSVPAGSGSAPTTLESAAPESEAPPKKLGYVATFLNWIMEWTSWALGKVFFCWAKKPEEPPPPEPEEPSPEPEEPPAPPPAPRVISPPIITDRSILKDVEVLEAFDRLTDRQKSCIYIRIGMAVYNRFDPTHWCPYEQIGEHEVHSNPLVLRGYLILPQDQEPNPEASE